MLRRVPGGRLGRAAGGEGNRRGRAGGWLESFAVGGVHRCAALAPPRAEPCIPQGSGERLWGRAHLQRGRQGALRRGGAPAKGDEFGLRRHGAGVAAGRQLRQALRGGRVQQQKSDVSVERGGGVVRCGDHHALLAPKNARGGEVSGGCWREGM